MNSSPKMRDEMEVQNSTEDKSLPKSLSNWHSSHSINSLLQELPTGSAKNRNRTAVTARINWSRSMKSSHNLEHGIVAVPENNEQEDNLKTNPDGFKSTQNRDTDSNSGKSCEDSVYQRRDKPEKNLTENHDRLMIRSYTCSDKILDKVKCEGKHKLNAIIPEFFTDKNIAFWKRGAPSGVDLLTGPCGQQDSNSYIGKETFNSSKLSYLQGRSKPYETIPPFMYVRSDSLLTPPITNRQGLETKSQLVSGREDEFVSHHTSIYLKEHRRKEQSIPLSGETVDALHIVETIPEEDADGEQQDVHDEDERRCYQKYVYGHRLNVNLKSTPNDRNVTTSTSIQDTKTPPNFLLHLMEKQNIALSDCYSTDVNKAHNTLQQMTATDKEWTKTKPDVVSGAQCEARTAKASPVKFITERKARPEQILSHFGPVWADLLPNLREFSEHPLPGTSKDMHCDSTNFGRCDSRDSEQLASSESQTSGHGSSLSIGETSFLHDSSSIKYRVNETTNDDLTLTKSGVKITLLNSSLWKAFNTVGTEMIINRGGRRMFPYLAISVSGLRPDALYNVTLEIVPASCRRFKYINSKWVPVGLADAEPPQVPYFHPDSPNTGSHFGKIKITFSKVKLTNNKDSADGNILIHSMHKYHIVVKFTELTTKKNQPSADRTLTFSFPETDFIAVTAYQNEAVTQMKIHNNPFAKAFRDASFTTMRRNLSSRRKRQALTTGSPRHSSSSSCQVKSARRQMSSPFSETPTTTTAITSSPPPFSTMVSPLLPPGSSIWPMFQRDSAASSTGFTAQESSAIHTLSLPYFLPWMGFYPHLLPSSLHPSVYPTTTTQIPTDGSYDRKAKNDGPSVPDS